MQDTLSLLAYNSKTKSSAGLQSLVTPAKVLTQWHDSMFKQEFREFLKQQRESCPLDLPPKTRGSQEAGAEGGNPRPGKRARAGSAAEEPTAATSDDDYVDATDIGFPLTHEANLPANGKLQIVTTVGDGCFLVNKTGEAKSEGPGVVCFILKASSDAVVMNGKLTRFGELVKAKRVTNPADAHVSFHELTDAPTSSDPAAFTLNLKPKIQLAFLSDEAGKHGGPNEDSICAHGRRTAVVGMGRCRFASVVWAVKWPPVAGKGLQPIRPMVCALDAISVLKSHALGGT